MKRVAVVYSSKSGTTKICAEYIAAKIVGSQLFNLNDESPDISNYDTVLIGSGIRMAKLYKPVKKFLTKNAQILKDKKAILFLSNFYPETVDKTLQKNVPQDLLDKLTVIECGGVAPFGKVTDDVWLKKAEINAVLVDHGLI